MNTNQVLVIGRVGREAEVRYTKDQSKVVTVSVATSYKTKAGKESTEWHKVVAFGKMADQLAACSKGALVVVQGRLQTRKWQDKNGADRYTTEIVASLALQAIWHRPDDTGGGNHQPGGQQEAAEDFDDDIAF